MSADHSLPTATPFHRMATLRPAWTGRIRPLLTLAAAFTAYVVLISVVLVLTILVLALAPGVNVALGVTSGDPTSALDVALALAMGVMWLPAGIIGVRFGGWRPLGTAWSIAARPRRGLLRSLGPWSIAMGVAVVAAAGLAGAVTTAIAGGDGGGAGTSAGAADATGSVPQLLLVTLIVLVLAPLQAAGLELALRGVVMQALGTWLRSPLLPLLAAGAVMLIGRELSAAVLLPALTLGLASAILAWKSGGLELSILLVATITAASQLVSAVGAGTGAGAGGAALSAAAAAPGTSSAALATTASGSAALAGGLTAAAALLLLTAVMVARISARQGVRLREPVRRPAGEPAPAPVPY
ncbi:CAAX protease [Brachybacterium vulturis]|uniref:CAAX protease n=1 Tax=Brachybacterium vulturis TaxID=2017484 RepID=A0A291GIH8_9MICO|nr:CAAX protease [Brachybacterium vulturis]ATG50333.1 CAAX protease [Brachybacterium vulturis]